VFKYFSGFSFVKVKNQNPLSYNGLYHRHYKSRLSVDESTTVSFMSELLKLRDNHLYFSGDFHLDQVDIATLIDYVATSTV